MKKVIFIDIDQTICHTETGHDYRYAIPLLDNIRKANILYNQGNTIIYWTARGSLTGKNWQLLTYDQLQRWGVLYHEIRFDKPFYDIIIDDKALNAQDWSKDEE